MPVTYLASSLYETQIHKYLMQIRVPMNLFLLVKWPSRCFSRTHYKILVLWNLMDSLCMCSGEKHLRLNDFEMLRSTVVWAGWFSSSGSHTWLNTLLLSKDHLACGMFPFNFLYSSPWLKSILSRVDPILSSRQTNKKSKQTNKQNEKSAKLLSCFAEESFGEGLFKMLGT